uniref:Cytochrome b5 heme-binding domain-containing protein n=1 Tax=Dunaliella tertiolecta TaxID=3047 RepID=A0A7S3VK60_DUNTE|mmetsp:Transcript_14625/g.39575  ORF Transcript_14625/g.39575 Transcript_14625/m.39575 type:complete len:288 (-) Transcript_14625:341-1204(-)
MADFTFARHVPPSERPPLTAQSTVTHATAAGEKGKHEPVKLPAAKPPGLERNKVPLEKGYSQMDWLRLTRSKPAPLRRRDITLAEVKQHNKPEDAWMVFQGKVYDITPYLNFHPGGRDILLKAAGKDGTSLFMKYHPWVNIGALMEKCLLGTLGEPAAPPALSPPEPPVLPSTTQPTKVDPSGQGKVVRNVPPPPAFSSAPNGASDAAKLSTLSTSSVPSSTFSHGTQSQGRNLSSGEQDSHAGHERAEGNCEVPSNGHLQQGLDFQRGSQEEEKRGQVASLGTSCL